MIIQENGNSTLLKLTQEDLTSFLEQVLEQYDSYKNSNLILDLTPKTDANHKDVLLFGKLATLHKKNKKSLVLVMNENFDFNKASDKINIVPTLQEAFDVIEMEEIERDLGF